MQWSVLLAVSELMLPRGCFVRLIAILYLLCAGVPSAIAGENIAKVIERLPLNAKVSVARLYTALPERVWSPQNYQQLLAMVDASADEGLSPSDYHRDTLTKGSLSDIERDILASDAYLSLAAHFLEGKVDPVSVEVDWTAARRQRDLVIHLQKALSTGQITASLRMLLPSQPRYSALRVALQRYRQIADAPPWPTLRIDGLLRPGERSPQVPVLRQSLQVRGDLVASNDPVDPLVFSDELVVAVKRFQRRANSEPDGIVGPSTVRELNRGPSERIERLRVNMERWRWLPDDFGDRHIRVNIADYKLEAHEAADIVASYDVVVGRLQRKTPVFSSKMSYLVFNPWWETPSKLAKNDLLPKFQAKGSLVSELGYQVLSRDGRLVDASIVDWHSYTPKNFPYRLRQAPGKNNALGAVKFMFPNEHAVYLHDTPARDLFNKTRRDFSSGCIRVKDPLNLAQWVLANNADWPRSRIDAVIEQGKETTVSLHNKIPVHLLYWTAVVDNSEQGLRFIEDIYERDGRVLAALNQSSMVRQ